MIWPTDYDMMPSPPTKPVGHTLNPEEVQDAERDGVDIVSLATFTPRIRSGCFKRNDDGSWCFSGRTDDDALGLTFLNKDDAAALDRVREYWRRRALAEFAAAKVADLLGTALAAAREHAQLFAAIADDGVLPVDRAQKFRADAADLALPIREIERLHNSYKVHGDVP